MSMLEINEYNEIVEVGSSITFPLQGVSLSGDEESKQNQEELVKRWNAYEEVKAQQEELQKTKDKLEALIKVGESVEYKVMSYCRRLRDESMVYEADKLERIFLYDLRKLLPPPTLEFRFVALSVPDVLKVYIDNESVALIEEKLNSFSVIITTNRYGNPVQLKERITESYTKFKG